MAFGLQTMAPGLQTLWQAPSPTHLPSLTGTATVFPSISRSSYTPSEHTRTHFPQPVHFSASTYSMNAGIHSLPSFRMPVRYFLFWSIPLQQEQLGVESVFISITHGRITIMHCWKTLENHWKTIGKPLENHWKTIGKPLENHWKCCFCCIASSMLKNYPYISPFSYQFSLIPGSWF